VTAGFAEVNGARLWYQEAGSGPAVVLLHGHLIDSGQWDSQFGAFAREFRTVRYDARGFGRSDLPAGSFSFAEDLRALMTSLGIESAFLVGCSGGGATILDLALAHPEVVDALVLVGSAVAGYAFGGPMPAPLQERRQAEERGDVDRAVELGLRIWPTVLGGPTRSTSASASRWAR
jgi:pimeloyl-ACP methyl ester carboxylesterase